MVFESAWFERDPRGHAHYFVAGFVHGTPRTDSCSRQNRCAVGGAFFSGNDFYFVCVDVCLNLAPQRRTRPATAQANRRYGNLHLFENRECIFQAVGNAFHDRANDMAARVGSGQPEQRRARVRIKMRRALAHEIRHPECALGTGGR